MMQVVSREETEEVRRWSYAQITCARPRLRLLPRL